MLQAGYFSTGFTIRSRLLVQFLPPNGDLKPLSPNSVNVCNVGDGRLAKSLQRSSTVSHTSAASHIDQRRKCYTKEILTKM
ncbi:hypothetical protein HUJ05_003999 [Dendroctonus ponderosae]|nr:hypothetical protein HUJ05_003999 [Dendroctonus ponderosae]